MMFLATKEQFYACGCFAQAGGVFFLLFSF
jgi:hypothetical protein